MELELAVQGAEDRGHVHGLAASVLQANDGSADLTNGEHCSQRQVQHIHHSSQAQSSAKGESEPHKDGCARPRQQVQHWFVYVRKATTGIDTDNIHMTPAQCHSTA